jgi:hypothetical protein
MLATTLHHEHCIHDPGEEFPGQEIQTLLQNCHIRDVCTTAKNPQSNAMCKRMHQTVGNVLRTLLHGEPPQDMASAKEYINEALSIRTEQLRKLGRLKSYYLDQFNQMESSYAASERVQNSVAVGTAEIGLSPSRYCIPWEMFSSPR